MRGARAKTHKPKSRPIRFVAICRRDSIRETYVTRPWKIKAYRHDGDRIDLGGRSLEIIATPGHTPDAISLLDRRAWPALYR